MELSSNHIREQIIKMAGMVELSLSLALNKDVEPKKVQEIENQINQYQCMIDDLCFKYIALKSPNTKDLRLAISVLKINPILERIGDICLIIKRYNAELSYNFPKIESMGHIVKELLQKSIDTLVHGNTELADELNNNEDDELSTLNQELVEEFLMAMKNNQLEHREAINALWITKNLERIGDLALCITQEVFFIEAGEQNHYKKAMTITDKPDLLDLNKYLKSLNDNQILNGVDP